MDTEDKKETSKKQTLKGYLIEAGVDEKTTPEELATLKKKYRSIYLKNKRQERRKIIRRKEIFFTKDEFKQLEKYSENYKTPLGTFIKSCLFAYLDQSYILPDDHQVRLLELGIKKMGNNINQIIRYLHNNKNVTPRDVERLQNQLNKMETVISEALRKPENILDFIEQQIESNPNLIDQLDKKLTEIKTKN